MRIEHRTQFLTAMGASVIVAGLLTGCSGGDGTSRQDVVATRGASVMPFDQNKTQHIFDQNTTGGLELVRAIDPADAAQIALVRSHLQTETKKFATGDFSDPMGIHGQQMPGVAALSSAGARLQIEYSDLPDGGKITYSSADPVVVVAIHDWFTAQLGGHGEHASSH